MALKDIKIVVKDDRVEPEEGFSTQVESGGTVMFTAQPGGQGLNITFVGDSPFGDNKKVVPYGTPLTVAVPFNAADPNKNRYAYTCALKVDGKTLATEAGGEMEVIKK